MTARKTPQDHLPKTDPKVISSADSDEGLVLEMEWEGIHLVGRGDNVTGETMDEFAQGMIHRFIKDLFGHESWDGNPASKTPGLKTFPVRKLKDLVQAWGEATKSAGNS